MNRECFWIWAVLLLATACGGSAKSTCELAQDKLQECQPQLDARRGPNESFHRGPIVRDDCSGTNQCVASCVVPASCEAIVHFSYGFYGSTDPNAAPVMIAADSEVFVPCMLACLDQ